MKTEARVVVIGGGVVGVSTLYHLTKQGWSDVVLLERSELTAGSTWHAAGLLPLFNMSYAVGQIHKYSVDLYKRLEAETGQDVSFHVNGNLRLATSRERMDEYHKYCGTANTIGVPFEIITPKQVKELWPLCEIEGLVGALYHPDDGHCAPADLTNALAIGARKGGANIYRQTEVTGLEQKPNGEWRVATNRGEIICEHLVSATGNYARQTGAMVGLDLPVIPVQHQYIVTEPHPALVARHEQGLPELAVLREPAASYYMREERQGLILGPYEKGAPACFLDGVPKSWGQDLFPGDLDRLQSHIERAIERVPIFAEVGIKDVINGPIPYTPDGSPIIGPAWGLRNFWLNEGHSFGITAAGGAGKYLAEWIVEGEPGIDLLAVDPRRFGAYANKSYTKVKNEEAYVNVFTIHYPDEERPAGRPAKTSPIHAELSAAGAVWGQRYGWERPNWFASKGVAPRDECSFRRTNYFEPVGRECRALRERAGLIDITSFAKFEVFGPGAEAYLERLVANRLPAKVGRIKLAHALTQRGGVHSEFTIMRDGPERFYLVSSGAAERFDHDFLTKNLPEAGGVTVNNVTTAHGVLVLAGPRARDILARVTDADLSNQAFPWLSGRRIEVGCATVRAMRINFVGDLGWEIHHPVESQHHVFACLMDAGKEFGLALVGMRAMDSLRIEKTYRMWGQDLTRDYTLLEAGMDRFVDLEMGAFMGREALMRQREEGVPRRFVCLEVGAEEANSLGADALGNEPLWQGSRMVGRVTAGAYGHFLGRSLAQGYVRPAVAEPGTDLEIEILGQRKAAKVIPESPYDPENRSLRG